MSLFRYSHAYSNVFTAFVHPKLPLAARLGFAGERARPRAQQRGKTVRHRIGGCVRALTDIYPIPLRQKLDAHAGDDADRRACHSQLLFFLRLGRQLENGHILRRHPRPAHHQLHICLRLACKFPASVLHQTLVAGRGEYQHRQLVRAIRDNTLQSSDQMLTWLRYLSFVNRKDAERLAHKTGDSLQIVDFWQGLEQAKRWK